MADEQNRLTGTTFSNALIALRMGRKMYREGWNGNIHRDVEQPLLFVEAQFPDEHSKMGVPYLFIDARGLGGERAPWVPSITDLFADDWYECEGSQQ
jgi:hypothetical protein